MDCRRIRGDEDADSDPLIDARVGEGEDLDTLGFGMAIGAGRKLVLSAPMSVSP